MAFQCGAYCLGSRAWKHRLSADLRGEPWMYEPNILVDRVSCMVLGMGLGVGWLLPVCQYSWHSFASDLLYSFGDRTYLCVPVPG